MTGQEKAIAEFIPACRQRQRAWLTWLLAR